MEGGREGEVGGELLSRDIKRTSRFKKEGRREGGRKGGRGGKVSWDRGLNAWEGRKGGMEEGREGDVHGLGG